MNCSSPDTVCDWPETVDDTTPKIPLTLITVEATALRDRKKRRFEELRVTFACDVTLAILLDRNDESFPRKCCILFCQINMTAVK